VFQLFASLRTLKCRFTHPFNFDKERAVRKDEIIAAIQKCAQDLGYVPSRAELLEKTEISIFRLHKNFGSYVNALEACGL
jgi:hypothetical protein